MMQSKFYLIFSLHNVQYAIEANLVQELFFLPELMPIAEAPTDIVGLLNLRRKIVPIMHLDLRLGNSLQECRLNDSVILIAWEGLQIGIIVNTVHEVKNIDHQLIETEIEYGRLRNIHPAFVAGVAKLESEIIVLLNPEALIRQPDAVEALIKDATDDVVDAEDGQETGTETTFPETNKGQNLTKIISSFYELCCPHATAKEREIFRQRAENLRQATDEIAGSRRCCWTNPSRGNWSQQRIFWS